MLESLFNKVAGLQENYLIYQCKTRSSLPEVFSEKHVKFTKLREIHGKTPVSESQVCNFIKKETPIKEFSIEFSVIFKNTFLCRTAPTAASEK